MLAVAVPTLAYTAGAKAERYMRQVITTKRENTHARTPQDNRYKDIATRLCESTRAKMSCHKAKKIHSPIQTFFVNLPVYVCSVSV